MFGKHEGAGLSLRHMVHVAAARVHKWLALIIGIQLLIWFVSGFVMSWVPIERVRGEHLIETRSATIDPPEVASTTPRALAAAVGGQPVRSLTLRRLLDATVIEVERVDGSRVIHDAQSGSRLPTLGAAAAERIARGAYKNGEHSARAELVTAESTEYRGALPAWRIAFGDPEGTRVYIVQATGRIAAVRTDGWRLYDFLWGLHIMDWKNHENFNTPWLSGFAAAGTALALAGAILLFMRRPWKRRRKPISAANRGTL